MRKSFERHGRCLVRGITICIACTAASSAVLAQTSPSVVAPTIVVTGHGEVLVPPTKASFTVSVTTTKPTAAAAGEENARTTKAVMESLKAAHLSREEITGSSLSISPHWDFSEHPPRRTGFDATNAIQIETERLDQIGAIIDAALAAGANDVSPAEFSAKDTSQARRQALAQAIATARGDAAAMASAGGGTLGELVLLSTGSDFARPGYQEIVVTAARRSGAVGTELIPSQIRVTAQVEARWRFVPTGLTK